MQLFTVLEQGYKPIFTGNIGFSRVLQIITNQSCYKAFIQICLWTHQLLSWCFSKRLVFSRTQLAGTPGYGFWIVTTFLEYLIYYHFCVKLWTNTIQ